MTFINRRDAETRRRNRLGLCVWASLRLTVLLPFIGGCSIPAIESADCTAARDVTKRYYSLAIGGDLAHQPDALAQINKLRAPGFSASGADTNGGRDAYNFSLITPSSSRVDECSDLGNGKVRTDVTVIWRQNDQNYLRKDKVTLQKSGGTWLVEHINVGPQPAPNF
jgi:hypothetical protein